MKRVESVLKGEREGRRRFPIRLDMKLRIEVRGIGVQRVLVNKERAKVKLTTKAAEAHFRCLGNCGPAGGKQRGRNKV